MSSPISRLPDSATRLISSHVVVVTPVSLVKELLENAIDAKANSVEILISSDTISKIEVRDDGTGIHPSDYDALGRRGHTSKLRSIEELGTVVGKSLGFRGEALASVNSMADITVTTKTSTEPIAAILRLKPGEGGVLSQKPTSAPAGTTVSVTNLFDRQPVRKQIAVKEAKRTLEKIQELLRSYAMARPQFRLLFKVLQSSTKAWSYSPRRSGAVNEAVTQLVGSETTSGCVLKTFQASFKDTYSKSATEKASNLANGDLALEAFLANPNRQPQRASKCHYFSVDGRPVNAGRGIAKRLLNIYREHLKSSTLLTDLGDCFIRLNISCPPGSYDANIEPSKDDVLFLDEQVILDAFRRLCEGIYKPATMDCRDTSRKSSNGASPLEPGQAHRVDGEQAELIIASPSPEVVENAPVIHDQPVDQADIIRRMVGGQALERARPSTTFKPINAANLPNSSRCPQFRSSGIQKDKTRSAPNMGTVDMSVDLSERPKRRQGRLNQVVPELLDSQKTAIRATGRDNAAQNLNPFELTENGISNPISDTVIQYPPTAPLTPEPPVLRHIMAPPGDLDIPASQQDAGRGKLLYLQRTTVPGGPYRSPVSSPLQNRPRGVPIAVLDRPQINIGRHRRRDQPPWTPPSSIRKTDNSTSQPDSVQSQSSDGFKQTKISFGGAKARRHQRVVQDDLSESQIKSKKLVDDVEPDGRLHMQDMISTAKNSLDYQLSRMEGDRLTKVIHNSTPRPNQRRPFDVLRTNLLGNKEIPQADREPIATTLPIGDSRAYLLRRQKSMAAEESGSKPKRLKRVKSSLMPLENIFPEHDTHSLSLSVSIDSPTLDELVQWTRQYDEYVIYGSLLDGLEMSLAEGQIVETQLQKLLSEQKENIADRDAGEGPVIVGLKAALKGKGVPDAPVA